MQKIGSWHSYLSTQQAPDQEIGSIPSWVDNSLATSLFRQILPRYIQIFGRSHSSMCLQKIGSRHSYLSTQQDPDPEIDSISAGWADNSLAIGRYYPAL